MTQPSTQTFPRTIGMDLGSRSTSYCIVSPDAERLSEGTLHTTKLEMHEFFESEPSSRVVIEASGPSRWVAEVAQDHGREVGVEIPRAADQQAGRSAFAPTLSRGLGQR